MEGWRGGRSGSGPRSQSPSQRTSKPIAEQERYRWLAGDRGAWEITQTCPATLGVNLADREGDIQEWLVAARRREPPQRAEVSIRACTPWFGAPGFWVPLLLAAPTALCIALPDNTMAFYWAAPGSHDDAGSPLRGGATHADSHRPTITF